MSDASDQSARAVGANRVLHADTRKWLGVLAIGAAFVVIGIAMIIIKGDFLAWFTTLFFALVAGVATLQIVGLGSHLELNADTFTIINFGRRTTERWDECADFTVYRTNYNKQVCYDRARDIETHAGEMNRSISGRTAGLPDTFGISAEELSGLMNAYQRHAVERAWQSHAEAVTNHRTTIAAALDDGGQVATITIDSAAMDLPKDMPAWPSILAIAKVPHPDGSRHIVICADILSPTSRWITRHTKQQQAYDLLAADELQIIDPETGQVERIPRA